MDYRRAKTEMDEGRHLDVSRETFDMVAKVLGVVLKMFLELVSVTSREIWKGEKVWCKALEVDETLKA